MQWLRGQKLLQSVPGIGLKECIVGNKVTFSGALPLKTYKSFIKKSVSAVILVNANPKMRMNIWYQI